MNKSKLKQQLARRAVVMEIGGFRPPEDPAASWFGKVNLALPGQSWPLSEAQPMHALCQINLAELPFRPPQLDDLAMITVFIGPSELPIDEPNGRNWCLRAYKNLHELCPLLKPEARSPIKAFPLRPQVVEADFACLDDVSEMGIEVDDDEYIERFQNAGGFKLGGWPTLIQSPISWASGDGLPIDPQYVFQIDSCPKAQWQWGDGGVGYFGRGTAEDFKDEWTLSWQCN